MSQNEHVPEELNEELADTERMLVTLAPRASRVDRDRLMIRLGEQNASRSSNPWKWATAASLLLALGLGVRPALETPGVATLDDAPMAIQSDVASPQQTPAEAAPPADQEDVPQGKDRQRSAESDWLLALASGRFDSRPLTVRPGLTTAEVAVRGDEESVAGESPDASSPARTPTLRWGDRRRQEAMEFAAPPRT